jgi:hypothetical protein
MGFFAYPATSSADGIFNLMLLGGIAAAIWVLLDAFIFDPMRRQSRREYEEWHKERIRKAYIAACERRHGKSAPATPEPADG